MFAAYNYFASDLPDPNVLDEIVPAESTYVYDRSGEVLLARFECQNREAVDVRRAAGGGLAGDRRQRGPHVLGEQRRRLPGPGARRARQPRGRRDRPGCVDHHAAGHRLRACPERRGGHDPGRGGGNARAECRGGRPRRAGHRGAGCRGRGGRLPAAGADAVERRRGQDPREHPGHAGDRGVSGPLGQGADPRDLPEPDLLRERLVRRSRRPPRTTSASATSPS